LNKINKNVFLVVDGHGQKFGGLESTREGRGPRGRFYPYLLYPKPSF
jgi:hypothetical protein